MNLLISDDQSQILDSLSSFLSEQAPVSRFRPPAPQIGNADALLWPQLAELGFFGIAISEAQGGIGLGAAEEMLACREFGRQLISPAILGLTLGAHIAAACGSELLATLLAGNTKVAIANACGAATLGAECNGTFHLFDAQGASWVLACDASGAALFQREDFSAIEQVPATDHVLILERARLVGIKPRLWIDSATNPIHLRARLLIAAYAVGIAEAARDMAVNYAKTREQFGKPIGSFQAVKHLCADMAIRAESALSQVTYASLIFDEEPESADFHVTAGKLVAIEAALKNAATSIQVHGAIGFTAEADAHTYLKRAHVVDQLWGDTRSQRERMLAAEFPG